MRFMVYGLGFRFRALRVEARQAHLGDVCACFKVVSLFKFALRACLKRISVEGLGLQGEHSAIAGLGSIGFRV